MESRTVATLALTVRHSIHLARPQLYLLKNILFVNFFNFWPHKNLDLDHNPKSVNLNMKHHLGIIFLFCKKHSQLTVNGWSIFLESQKSTYLRTELSVLLHSSLLIMVTLPSRRSPQVPLSVFPKPWT
jgi:hypothetical protein